MKKSLLIFIIGLLLCCTSGLAAPASLHSPDSIAFVKLDDELLSLLDRYSGQVDSLYKRITHVLGDSVVDEGRHRDGCCWLVRFYDGDTLWVLLELIDPFVKDIAPEHFDLADDSGILIFAQTVCNDGTKVYLEGSTLTNKLYVPMEDRRMDRDLSYFDYGVIVGLFYYHNNTFTEVPMIIIEE